MGVRFGFVIGVPVLLVNGIINNYRALRKQEFSGVAAGVFYERHARTLLLCLFVFHVAATLFFFPPGDILNDKPVVTLDHSFHYYQAWRAKQILLATGQLHAYDPNFMAGFPSAIFDLDVKGSEVFCSLFPIDQVARGFKLFILICYLTMVFTVYRGSRLLGFEPRESLLGVAVLLVFWHWGRPYASHFRYAGMFEFIFVSHLSILVIGLFRRFLRGGGLLGFFILGPIVFLIHPTAVVVLAVPFLLLIAVEYKRLTLKRSLVFLVWCGTVILVNTIWVLPMFEYVSVKSSSKAFFQTCGVKDLACVLFHPGCFPALVLLVFGALGAGRVVKEKRIAAAMMFPSVLFLFAISSYGVYLPGFEHLEPGRFLLTTLFFVVPLVGAGAAFLIDEVGRILRSDRRRIVFERAVLAVLIVSPVVLSFLSARTGYKHRITTSFTPEVEELIGVLTEETDPTGRLMIEDGPAALYGETHMPGILPIFTGVEQIGGPYPYTFLKHHFATFQRNKTFGKPLGELSPAEFWGYVDLYNVRWILAASAETRTYISEIADKSRAAPRNWGIEGSEESEVAGIVWSSPHYTLWRVNRPASFTQAKGDSAWATFNRIEVDLGRDYEAVLLRYHWDRGMRVDPPATLKPVHQLGDPVPFALVEPNGVSSIVIEH